MNRLARKIGIAIVSVVIATSQCIIFADDIKEETEATEAAVTETTVTETVINETVVAETDDVIEYEVSIDKAITNVKPSDDFNSIATSSAIVIKLDTLSLTEHEEEVTLIEETKSNVDPCEGESIIINTSVDESIVESDSSDIVVDNTLSDNSLIDNTLSDNATIDDLSAESNISEVTTGASTMIFIEESVETATGAACEIEDADTTQDPLQIEPIQYIERIEKVEIENLSDLLNVNMSYTTADYKRLDIKVNYEVTLDIEADQIEIEDSFFGKTILNKVDGVYKGEASKIVGFEDVMQSLIVKGFYNAKVLEAVIADKIGPTALDHIESVMPEDKEPMDDSLGI